MQLANLLKKSRTQLHVATPHGSDKNATKLDMINLETHFMLQLPTGQIKMQPNNLELIIVDDVVIVATPHGSDKNAT